MASLFANAKKVEAPKSKAKKSDHEEIETSGLLQLAEVDALMKALATIKTTLEQDVKANAFEHFFEEAKKLQKQPPSYRGIDGIASASIEMRKRGANSSLNDEEVALLTENKIPVEKVVSTQRMFGINPAYEHDEKLLALVSKKLEKIVPDDFIVVQEESSRSVVGESTIDAAFKTTNREVIEMVTTLAIKSKLDVVDITKILADVTAIIIPKKK
jgi:hypothetical protein